MVCARRSMFLISNGLPAELARHGRLDGPRRRHRQDQLRRLIPIDFDRIMNSQLVLAAQIRPVASLCTNPRVMGVVICDALFSRRVSRTADERSDDQ